MRGSWIFPALLMAAAKTEAMISWSELSAQPLPAPAHLIAYGKDRLQFAELRLPASQGPHPVVVLVHGGCWLNQYDYIYMTRLAQALADAGHATWTPEYRRIGDTGGGWPGTFLDVAAATDHLRVLAKKHPLDLGRVVALGHSAGGHLALWLATRADLPKKNNPLLATDPLKLKGVVGLAAITDLRDYSMGPQDGCNGSVRKLMGGMPEEVTRRYRLGSPLEQKRFQVPARLIHGGRDPIVPLSQAQNFARRHPSAEVIELKNLGHFDPVSARSRAWPVLLKAVNELSGRRMPR